MPSSHEHQASPPPEGQPPASRNSSAPVATTVGSQARGALFDMDRTLVSVNTGRLFVRWRRQEKDMSTRDTLRAMRYLLLYSLGLLDAENVVRRVLRSTRGIEEQRFADACSAWFEQAVKPHISAAARSEVARCQARGDLCAILSAQTAYVTRPLARELGIKHVLCTELEVENGKFTGRHLPPMCYGEGKTTHATRWAEQHGLGFERCAFYTDSISDLPMLDLVGEPRVINPDLRLRWTARMRRWPVQQWR